MSRKVSRLAPSPTGAQHLGNARTYLLAYWAARSAGAELILRIEDIDSPRVKLWAMAQAIDDLRWLGIDWDEGPDFVSGEKSDSPFVQSNRTALYAEALARLRQADRVYPCTCTRKDIAAAASAPHASDGLIRYPGTCSGWHEGDAVPDPGSYCWRFRCDSLVDKFDDLVSGTQWCSTATRLGDFPVTRKTGEFAYQLAVVVDDAAMNVSEVVRGDDLIESSFWQSQLYRGLGLPVPEFAHVPLVVGPDGRRLAKRHGDTRLSFFRDKGVDPARIIRWAAMTAGLATESDADPLGHADMIDRFDWKKISKHRIVARQNDFL